MPVLLLITHEPSANTARLARAAERGAQSAQAEGLEIRRLKPFDAQPEDVLEASAILLGTTENFGYMSGALKDFFDRVYYPCLERTQGLPYALYVRAGNDGTGTCTSVERIVAGLGWKAVQEPLVMRGDWQDTFPSQCQELGLTLAAGLEAGIF